MAKPQAVKINSFVAVSLEAGTAPNNCYIGVVEDVDEYGLRINLIHWDEELDMVGGYTESLFLPWKNVTSILISAEERPTKRFLSMRAKSWQAKIEALRSTKTGSDSGAGSHKRSRNSQDSQTGKTAK